MTKHKLTLDSEFEKSHDERMKSRFDGSILRVISIIVEESQNIVISP